MKQKVHKLARIHHLLDLFKKASYNVTELKQKGGTAMSVFELGMLICFGVSWPISVWKSYTSGSTKGKSVIFTSAIILGYLAGICGKILGGNINYVLMLYVLNLCFVSVDFALYFINRKKERGQSPQETARLS